MAIIIIIALFIITYYVSTLIKKSKKVPEINKEEEIIVNKSLEKDKVMKVVLLYGPCCNVKAVCPDPSIPIVANFNQAISDEQMPHFIFEKQFVKEKGLRNLPDIVKINTNTGEAALFSDNIRKLGRDNYITFCEWLVNDKAFDQH